MARGILSRKRQSRAGNDEIGKWRGEEENATRITAVTLFTAFTPASRVGKTTQRRTGCGNDSRYSSGRNPSGVPKGACHA